MPELSDIKNDLIRQEIEEFIENDDERRHVIQLYAAARPSLQDVAAAIITGDHLTVDRLTRDSLDAEIGALEIMDDGLIAGMAIVGIKFRENFIFVPEVLACARAMKAGMAHIEPILSASGVEPLGRIIMGTVKGDMHDIGKNLCIMMLRGAGFEVIDLGEGVPPQKFIETVVGEQASLIAMSALLTLTMPVMKETIEELKEAGLENQVKTLVGGATVNQEFADEIGADGYAPDAVSAVQKAKELLNLS